MSKENIYKVSAKKFQQYRPNIFKFKKNVLFVKNLCLKIDMGPNRLKNQFTKKSCFANTLSFTASVWPNGWRITPGVHSVTKKREM